MKMIVILWCINVDNLHGFLGDSSAVLSCAEMNKLSSNSRRYVALAGYLLLWAYQQWVCLVPRKGVKKVL
jgi:hypothetical protein